jgi:hypothetical protein
VTHRLLGRTRRGRSHGRAALLCLATLLSRPATGAAEGSPMRAAATRLACGDLEDVTVALDALAAAPTTPFGVPDESLTGTDQGLASVEYDNLLDALANARQRFPELSPRIDALLAGWDFCALTADETRWDLALRDGEVVRARPALLSPLLGQGFAAWSLLPRAEGGRPRWNANVAPPSGPLTAPQCQSHQSLSTTPRGPLPIATDIATEPDVTCQGPPPRIVVAPPVIADPGSSRAPSAAASRERKARSVRAADGEDQHEVASPNTREATAALPGTVTASLTLSATGNLNTGLGLSLAPRRNIFARASLSWRWMIDWRDAIDLEPTWSWGIGYDDWRPGTFSLQLNNWGPLRRGGQGRALDGAVLNLGYKIPLPALWSKYLSLRADLSTPLSWAPAVGVGVAVKLPYGCFASFGISQRLEGPFGPTWSYVFGRSLWKPGTLSVVFANYGPNKLDELRLRGLAMTLSWLWSL